MNNKAFVLDINDQVVKVRGTGIEFEIKSFKNAWEAITKAYTFASNAIELKVRHIGNTVRIPINGAIHYECDECQDTGRVEIQTAVDDFVVKRCIHCSMGEDIDMSGADGGYDR